MDVFVSHHVRKKAEVERHRPSYACLLEGTIQTELSIGLRSRRTNKGPRKLVKRVLPVVPFVR